MEKEYEKNPELKSTDVDLLRNWVVKQAHLPQDISDLQLVLFLQSCYFRMEQAKMALDNYFTVRTQFSSVFYDNSTLETGCISPNLAEAMSTGLVTYLPQVTHEGYQVLFTCLMDTNSEHYNTQNMANYFDMYLVLKQHHSGTHKGFVLVVDADGTTFGHMIKWSIGIQVVRTYLFFVQEAVPIRLKSIHVINVNPIVEKIMALVKPFMSKALIDLVHFHTKMEGLFEVVPQVCLPQEYGGEGGTCKSLQEISVKEVLDNLDFFRYHKNQQVVESARIGPSKLSGISSDVGNFGTDGSFRKLDLD